MPIGIIASLVVCTVLYICVAAVLTGMVPWQEINIEAPIAVAFLDRGLTTASNIITVGALAGLTSVMLVMLLGQTRVLYSMANDGLLPRKFFAAIHPQVPHAVEEHHSGRPAGGHRRQRHPIDDIGKMVNIGTLAGLRHRVHRRDGSAPHQSRPGAPVPHAVGFRWSPFSASSSTAT